MTIFLLTHQRELLKKTNTGSLVVDVLGENAKVIVWERKNPDPELLKYIDEGTVALLYPSANSQLITETANVQHYIIIDGTWQEAQKIYNRSPYLSGLPVVKIPAGTPSAFNLRRNQRADCLCTCECVIEVLKARGFSTLATKLQKVFIRFLAEKSNKTVSELKS
ncbi:MAG: tRNA-uridine aminocarboxypropyltransferase [Motiliproteus sp.]